MQRREPSAEAGDVLDIAHAERGLDQRLEAHARRQALALLDLVDHRLDHVEVGRHAHLGHEERMHARTRLLHHVYDVAIHVMRVEPVDPHRDGLALRRPVDVVERLDRVLARLLLFGGRDRVLEVEKDVIGGAGRGLVDHGRVRGGDGEFRALQALAAERVEGVAHGKIPVGRVGAT